MSRKYGNTLPNIFDETYLIQHLKHLDKFQFEIQAFSFTSSIDAVYLHCDLKVCLNDNGDKAMECDQVHEFL